METKKIKRLTEEDLEDSETWGLSLPTRGVSLPRTKRKKKEKEKPGGKKEEPRKERENKKKKKDVRIEEDFPWETPLSLISFFLSRNITPGDDVYA